MYVYLSSGNYWADLVAQVDTMNGNYMVSISVVTPDGDFIPLGDISGAGSKTDPYEIFYAGAGTYTFTFYSVCTTPYQVSAFIFD